MDKQIILLTIEIYPPLETLPASGGKSLNDISACRKVYFVTKAGCKSCRIITRWNICVQNGNK